MEQFLIVGAVILFVLLVFVFLLEIIVPNLHSRIITEEQMDAFFEENERLARLDRLEQVQQRYKKYRRRSNLFH